MIHFCVNPGGVEHFLDRLIGPGAPFTPLLVRLIIMGVTLLHSQSNRWCLWDFRSAVVGYFLLVLINLTCYFVLALHKCLLYAIICSYACYNNFFVHLS